VPSNSQVIYSAVNGTPIEIQDSALVTQHEIVIRNLVDDSDYTMVAQSRDAVGNLAVSDRQQFRTALDTRPPKISDIVVESTIRGSGSEARGQIVVSWRTDEPATSQIAYSEGSGAVVFNSRTAEETTLKTEHLVIVSDLPTSRVFSIQPISRDKSENTGNGTTETAIIGRASDNALTVVFNTLKRIFGFYMAEALFQRKKLERHLQPRRHTDNCRARGVGHRTKRFCDDNLWCIGEWQVKPPKRTLRPSAADQRYAPL
jgi:hypothetical protein